MSLTVEDRNVATCQNILIYNSATLLMSLCEIASTLMFQQKTDVFLLSLTQTNLKLASRNLEFLKNYY